MDELSKHDADKIMQQVNEALKENTKLFSTTPQTKEEVVEHVRKYFFGIIQRFAQSKGVNFDPQIEVIPCPCDCGNVEVRAKNFQTFLAAHGHVTADELVLNSGQYKAPECIYGWSDGKGYVQPYMPVERITFTGKIDPTIFN